jgi:hypothetical protein
VPLTRSLSSSESRHLNSLTNPRPLTNTPVPQCPLTTPSQTLSERTSEDFEVVSPVRAEDNAYSALDRLVQAAGLEQATRPQSPQVPVEQLSPLTLAPVPSH